ncbi:sensor histidine kinase [Nocardioides sp. Kera G14]|uniref:sensor histidine kinase n=1 Tax=Nocardioides sp. Kera G14 TaxID=2884264 RepID=UPI001D10D0CB|nr:HAMP domain-containing sensor histidine kinase [Nocardioides sp. Kera G14]UDY23645.1 HAMP domain-containing histidine kinase [Nocardioides sp. Kera G14]
MNSTILAELTLATEEDLFLARALGRDCGEGLGMDRLDALRVATAISELGREVVATGQGQLCLTVEGTGILVIAISAPAVPPQWEAALRAAARLVDGVEEVRSPLRGGEGVDVRLEKGLGRMKPTESELGELADKLLVRHASTASDELRQQNRDLIATLEEVRRQADALASVNRELEETNRGVMALYTELSEEMERTNQGVVALYAEIDDKNLQLREASEAKSRFLRSISHELRTPVNSILGLTGLLLDPHQVHPLPDEHTEPVRYIRASANDLLRLVEELLDLAKAESGRLVPTLGEVELEPLFDELRGVIEPILRPGVTMSTEIDGVDLLTTDQELLRHILRNLLSNAAKFTDSGSITLTAARDGEYVELSVSDTGVGIAPEERDRIFEEFYQAASPLHATARGTGLGLPFAQLVATTLGGRIELESSVGVGSRFRLRLPIAGVGGDGA